MLSIFAFQFLLLLQFLKYIFAIHKTLTIHYFIYLFILLDPTKYLNILRDLFTHWSHQHCTLLMNFFINNFCNCRLFFNHVLYLLGSCFLF